MRKNIVRILLFLNVLLVCGVSFYFGIYLNEVHTEKIETKEIIKEVSIKENSLSPSVSKVYESVIMVQTYKGRSINSTGTGFIYKKDDKYGYIITNYHVIDSGSRYEAVFSNNKKSDMVLLGGDSYVDIAVLRVPVSYVEKVSIIGDESKMNLGDTVFTIGSPLGSKYMGTVTRGILSGLDRMVSLNEDTKNEWIMNVMQTDAAINPGNSGGPLLNVNGEVIGVNSLKLVQDEVEGMGFAIPITDVMGYVKCFEKGEKLVRPLLGISMIDADDSYYLYAANIDLDSKIENGVVVESVVKNTPAFKAGLKRKDVILKIGDVDITNKLFLKYYLYKYNIGDIVKITYFREGSIKTVNVLLDKIVE